MIGLSADLRLAATKTLQGYCQGWLDPTESGL